MIARLISMISFFIFLTFSKEIIIQPAIPPRKKFNIASGASSPDANTRRLAEIVEAASDIKKR